MLKSEAIEMIKLEYVQAVNQYPKFNSEHEGYAVLLEEVDELWDEIKTNNHSKAKKEAIQAAAMALRFLTDCC